MEDGDITLVSLIEGWGKNLMQYPNFLLVYHHIGNGIVVKLFLLVEKWIFWVFRLPETNKIQLSKPHLQTFAIFLHTAR